MSRAHRWINRTILGIGLASFFSDLSHETVTSLLPAWLATCGGAAAMLGTVEGVADGFSMLAKLYGGWLADRLQRRKPLCASGYAVMGLSPLIIAAAANPFLILLGRTMAWVSRGLRTPARKALLAAAVEPEFYGRAFGLERALDTTGAILAPLLALVLLSAGFVHRQVILFSIIPGLLAAVCIMVFVSEDQKRVPVQHGLFSSMTSLPRPLYRFLLGVGIFGLGDFADTFYILYAVTKLTPQVGANEAARMSVVLYAIHNVAYALLSYGGGWLSDYVNRRVLLLTGYLCAAAASLAMACQISGIPSLVVLFALGGAAVGIYEAVEDAIVADLVPDSQRGNAYGALAVTTGTGDLLSSVSVGALWASFGAGIAFASAAVVMLTGILLVAFAALRESKTMPIEGS